MQRFTAPYMPVCLMKRRPPMGPAVRSTACGIMENPGIPGNIRNDGGSIPISHDISERPAGAANRSRRGHWECDIIAGKTGKACLVTLVDRKSRYLVGGKAAKKTAQAVNTVLLQVLQGQPVKSLTPDRGKEFAHHAAVTEALNGVPFYFPPPHQPWQRGKQRKYQWPSPRVFPERDRHHTRSRSLCASCFCRTKSPSPKMFRIQNAIRSTLL